MGKQFWGVWTGSRTRGPRKEEHHKVDCAKGDSSPPQESRGGYAVADPGGREAAADALGRLDRDDQPIRLAAAMQGGADERCEKGPDLGI